jgi:hypothetical protein
VKLHLFLKKSQNHWGNFTEINVFLLLKKEENQVIENIFNHHYYK